MLMIGYYQSPFGLIRYKYQNHTISSMSFVDEVPQIQTKNESINQALENYFNGQQKSFDFDYNFNGFTSFQVDVFKAMLDIPYGQTRSYKDIAIAIGRPKAFRAVGQACKRNPVAIMVPCHRVIGSDQSLVGYSGKNYIHLKKKLLDLEKENTIY